MCRILVEIEREPKDACGADIMKAIDCPSGSLYPALRRLEKAGWLVKNKEKGDPRALGRPLKTFYQLTLLGRKSLKEVRSALRVT
jgi:DNA-binding PadR family transcriptional regulator